MTTILGEGFIKKTRKNHSCYICDSTILKGESCYWQTNTGTEESDFGTAYWHVDCDRDKEQEEY